MSWMYRAGRAAARFCLTFFGRLEVTGQECVPPYGPLIVISNHLSYNDPPALFASLPRSLSYLGKVELFSNPIKRTVMRWVNVFPLNRARTGVDGMRTALDLLAQDRALVIFPEGRISLDKSLERAKGGAAFLAIKSQAPILPVGISGTEKFPPWRMVFPFRRYRVNIGPPFTPPVLEGRIGREAINGVAEMMMNRIAVLLPEEYRGVYALTQREERHGSTEPDPGEAAPATDVPA